VTERQDFRLAGGIEESLLPIRGGAMKEPGLVDEEGHQPSFMRTQTGTSVPI